MISVGDLTVRFGGFTLLDHISFHISENEKIALVGKNGAGKSTLMKIICGLQSPTSGSIDKPEGVRVGYLPQIMEHHRGRTVLEETLTAFDEVNAVEQELARVTREMETRTDYESPGYLRLIEEMGELSDRLSAFHSEPPRVQAERTLKGLGFLPDELDRRTETFSQGWNMRIELAKILLRQPDLLLLDEPTNHLDIESIEWLEGYLKNCGSALLLVSHDRKFLDTVTTRTVELVLGRIHDYKVPYTQYLALRAERLEQQTAAYENQQRMIEKTEDFIRAFRYKPTKSNQVQSRIKALEKLERVQIDETDNATLTVKFPPAPRSGDVVFKAEGLKAGYPGANGPKVVFSDAAVELRRGEKVALVGRNGEGKTTLMRVLTGELAPLDGEVFRGHNVKMGYFAQNQEDVLDPRETVFSTLDRIAVGDIRSKLRDILAQFLFRGEDIDKRVSVLSGGERARLGMAKLMLQSHNLLLLDEPTNHMDIKSKDILKQALQAYDGTLVVVSHDRDFLDGLVDKIYEFRGGRVREYLGGVQVFLERRKLESLQELERSSSAPAAADEAKTQRREEFRQNRAQGREDRKKKNRISWLETEIARLEARQKEIEAKLSAPGENDDVLELTRAYLEYKRELDARTDEWGSLI
ncbi:MAG: ABC-F family ATP-binding cassette domain-containing protein [Bacteroidales bacterium]|nr:ABC-F family ATP-binding cassette domain-containing protein [Bacteroidales bacterium]